jgi:hypothetical protein
MGAYYSIPINGMNRFFGSERLLPKKKPAQHLIAEVSGRRSRVDMTIGIDLGLDTSGPLIENALVGTYQASAPELSLLFLNPKME